MTPHQRAAEYGRAHRYDLDGRIDAVENSAFAGSIVSVSAARVEARRQLAIVLERAWLAGRASVAADKRAKARKAGRK